MKGLFITGTDTDAGKTTVTAALLRALKVAGVPAAAVKPVQTGCVMRGGEEENRGEEGTFLKKGCPPYPPPPAQDVRLVGRPRLMRGLSRREGMGTPCRRERKTVLVAAVGKVVPVLPNT